MPPKLAYPFFFCGSHYTQHESPEAFNLFCRMDVTAFNQLQPVLNPLLENVDCNLAALDSVPQQEPPSAPPPR